VDARHVIPCFATTSPGLEPILVDELRAVGFSTARPGRSGAHFETDRAGLMRACLVLRTAHRVLWTLGTAPARDAQALYGGVRRIADWPSLVPPSSTLAVFATAKDSAFRDARLAALTTKDAIVDAVRDALGERPNVDAADPDLLVRVRVHGKKAIVALDAAGRASLHARGYRTEAGEAPIRETLGAAMILASGWDRRSPLLDPLAGAGTLLIEAALLARDRAPGLLRGGFGFERWADHDPAVFDAVRARVAAGAVERSAELWGCDADPGAVAMAEANARRAGVAGDLRLSHRRLVDLFNPAPRARTGVVVANPPYGQRMGELNEARELLILLGARLREHFPGWTACVIAPARLVDALGLRVARQWPVRSGTLPLAVVRCDVPRRR